MALRSTRLLFLLSLSLSALFLVDALAKEDPELQQCRHQCKHQTQFTGEERQQCERRCEEYAGEKQARERSERQKRTGGGEEEEWDIDNFDRKRLEECRERCERQGEQQQQQQREGWQREKERCRESCETRFGRRNLQREEEEEDPRWGEEGWDEEEEFGRKESGRPYVFERHEFETVFETESGRAGVLPRFGKRSKILQAIDDFRLGFLEIDPHAFVVPQHFDADGVLFVVKGSGTFSVLKEDKKDNIDIEAGDIVRIRAGSPAYLVNRDSNERLQIVMLFKPVNTPGHFETYHGTSGRDRESFYTAFSLDVLEAALKTDRQSLEEVFRQQRQGSVVQASKEQVEALSGGKREELSWPFGIGDSKGSKTKGSKSSQAFNIFNKKPFKSNQFGQLHVVDADDLKGLKDLDVGVTFVNITKGAMFGPYFNSRATKICLVPEDEGYFEMACPHLSSRKSHRHRHHERYGQGDSEFGRGERYGRGDSEFGRGERYGRGDSEFGQGERYGRGDSEFGRGERHGRGDSEFGRGDSEFGRGDSRYERGDSRTYRHHKQGRVQTYQTVRSRLQHGTVFVVPAGHPVVSLASEKNNLQIVCFEVNAENNVRYALAGKNNIISLMDKEAKELAFDFPSREIDQVFGNQDEEFFFPGPGHQQQERRRHGRAAA